MQLLLRALEKLKQKETRTYDKVERLFQKEFQNLIDLTARANNEANLET